MSELRVVAEPGTTVITTEQWFDAPPEKVFTTYSQPDKIERWWVTAPGQSVKVELLELQGGGRWKFMSSDKNTGQEFVFHGSIHEVVKNERLIWTFEVSPTSEPGHVSLEKFEFIEDNGGTLLRTTSSFLSVADRDWMVNSGSEEGLRRSHELLSQILAE